MEVIYFFLVFIACAIVAFSVLIALLIRKAAKQHTPRHSRRADGYWWYER